VGESKQDGLLPSQRTKGDGLEGQGLGFVVIFYPTREGFIKIFKIYCTRRH
jgi:hypothetical protein